MRRVWRAYGDAAERDEARPSRYPGRCRKPRASILTFHRAMELRLRGFNAAYNARRQRVPEAVHPTKSRPSTSKPNPNSPIPHRLDV